MFLDILYYLTIRPLEILYEVVFSVLYGLFGKPLLTIIGLSIFVNLLVLPLYKRADSLQSDQRRREKEMEGRLSHIRKTFKGDERVMMTQAYYRLCDYKPVYALRGSSSLLLQIPFFISAYRFLSGVSLLKGTPSLLVGNLSDSEKALYLIQDLGAPDNAFWVGSFAVNVLPILMTLINIISGTIYSKGHPRKEKIQLYVTALVFLVLLYNSPSGLVLYWTFNNIFSLCKNAFQKIYEKRKPPETRLLDEKGKENPGEYDRVFWICALFMALLTGLYIPLGVLSSSPTEFISSADPFNPALYMVYSFSLGLGFFVIWTGIYYLFSSCRARKYFSSLMAGVCVCSLISFFMSGSGLGNISADLKYDLAPAFSGRQIFLNIILIVLGAALPMLISKYKPFALSGLLAIGCAAMICISFIDIRGISVDFSEYENMLGGSAAYNQMPEITLSRNGKNVIVLMLDRAMGSMLVYAVNERPDLVNLYDGFTYYHDTVSLGGFTNVGMPAVFGGYEYAPHEMNERENESLEEKTNEALKVLPVLFFKNDYEVTVLDPPYAGYSETPDLSIYDGYPEIKKYISWNKLNNKSEEMIADSMKKLKRNFFCFGMMKSVPLFLQGVLYDEGGYNYGTAAYEDKTTGTGYVLDENAGLSGQHVIDLEHATGLNYVFVEWYSVLDNMAEITNITDSGENEFLMMYNAAPHEPAILQLPDYIPLENVDNSAFDMEGYYTINGNTLRLDDETRLGTYQVDMACLLRLGEYFDYLRSEGVYDNTRIIIVADHGRAIGWFGGYAFGRFKESAEKYMPLFMVKDFDSHGFNISTEFMTNADACVLAVSGGVVEEAVNPFTGNPLDGHQKDEDVLWITSTNDWQIESNNGNKFKPAHWYTVKGTPYDLDAWEYLGFE